MMAKIYILYGAMAQSKRERMTHGARDLTDRQRQVAALVCAGHPSKVIARKMGVSEGTVKTHLHSIYLRLGIQDRAGLAKALSIS